MEEKAAEEFPVPGAGRAGRCGGRQSVNCRSLSVQENEHLYGPGKRLVVFLQGCSIRCRGCWNSHMWEFGGGTDTGTEEILRLCEGTEGITLLGGEPLDQAEGVLSIVRAVKGRGQTCVLFTGYRKKELKTPAQRACWDLSDLVIAGPYVEGKRSVRLQFRGSTNQRVYRHRGPYRHYEVRDGRTVALFTVTEEGVTARGFQDADLAEFWEELKETDRRAGGRDGSPAR